MYLRYLYLCIALLWGSGGFCFASEGVSKPPADQWVTNKIDYPEHLHSVQVQSNLFTNFFAEAVAGKIRIQWLCQSTGSNDITTLYYSPDYLSHTKAREWRFAKMQIKDNVAESFLPVDELDVPIVYFIHTKIAGAERLSPLRYVLPRSCGLEAPSRPFWNFLEGFEESIINWRVVNGYPDIPPLRTNVEPKNGLSALCVTLPAGRRTISVATTRIRGWHITHLNATGFAIWLRTNKGSGRAQFYIAQHAWTDKQVISQSSISPPVESKWKRFEVQFDTFPRIALSEIDLLIIEFIGEPQTEFWIDNLSLTGDWGFNFE